MLLYSMFPVFLVLSIYKSVGYFLSLLVGLALYYLLMSIFPVLYPQEMLRAKEPKYWIMLAIVVIAYPSVLVALYAFNKAT